MSDGKDSFGKSFTGDLGRVLLFFAALAAFGFLGIALSAQSRVEIAVFLIWSIACLLGGALVGFLFGIPKISQVEKGLRPNGDSKFYALRVNTNLEKISDWLTTIIVGLGLYQLSKIPGYLIALSDLLNEGVGVGNHRAFSLALIVYFTILGFLFGYLATRLFLASLFAQADQAAAAAVVEHLKETAKTVSPELFSQVLSKAPTEAIIEGELFQGEKKDGVEVELSDVDEEPEANGQEKVDYDKALKKLTEEK